MRVYTSIKVFSHLFMLRGRSVVTETGYSERSVENTSGVRAVGPVFRFGVSAGSVYTLKPVEYLFFRYIYIYISAIYWKKLC